MYGLVLSAGKRFVHRNNIEKSGDRNTPCIPAATPRRQKYVATPRFVIVATNGMLTKSLLPSINISKDTK